MLGPDCDLPVSGLKIPDFKQAINYVKINGLNSLPLKQQLVFGELFHIRDTVFAWDKSVAEGTDALTAGERALIRGLDQETVDGIRLDEQTLAELNQVDPSIQPQVDAAILEKEKENVLILLKQTEEAQINLAGDAETLATLKSDSKSSVWNNFSKEKKNNLKKLFDTEQSLTKATAHLNLAEAKVKENSGAVEIPLPDPDRITASRAFVEQIQQLPGLGAGTLETNQTGVAQKLADIRAQIRRKEFGIEPLLKQKELLQPDVEQVRLALEQGTELPANAQQLDNRLRALDYEINEINKLPDLKVLRATEDSLVRQEYLIRGTKDGFKQEFKVAGIPLPNLNRLLTWLDEAGDIPRAAAITDEEAEEISRKAREDLWNSLTGAYRSTIGKVVDAVQDVADRARKAGQPAEVDEAVREQTQRQQVTTERVEIKSGFDATDLENEIRDKMPMTVSSLKAQYQELAGENPVAAYDAWTRVFEDKVDPVMHDDELRSLAKEFIKQEGMGDQMATEALDSYLSTLDRRGVGNFLGIRSQLAYSTQRAGRIADKFLNLGAEASDELRADTSKLLVTQLAQTLGLRRAYRQTVRGVGRTLRAAGLPIAPEGGDAMATAWKAAVTKEMGERPAKMLGHPVSEKMGSAIAKTEMGQPVNWKDPQLKEELTVLSILAKDMESEPWNGVIADQIGKMAKGGVNALLTARTANILSSWSTFWKNSINGVFRVVTLPAYPVAGALVTPQKLPEAVKRAAMTYIQLGKQLEGALRLGAISFKEGVGLWDPQGTRVDGTTSAGVVDDMVEVRTELGWDLNNVTRPDFYEKFPHMSSMFNLLWKAQTLPLRLLSSSDTMLKAVSGNAEHWVRLYEQEYDRLVRKGDPDAASTAATRADTLLQASLMDVLVNPDDPRRRKVIRAAAMADETALNTGRQVTFTDELLIKPDKRSAQRGRELALQRGVDPADDVEMDGAISDYMRQNEGYRMSKHVTDLTKALWIWPQKINELKQVPGIGPVVSVVVPFLKTPTNLIKFAMRHSPTAPLVDSWWRDVTSEDLVTRQRARGEVVIGSTVIAGTLYALNHNTDFEITGAGPQEYNSSRVWREVQGKVPMSFRWRKDQDSEWSDWFSYAAFEPLATVVAMMADYRDMNAMMTEEQKERAAGILTLQILGRGATSAMGRTWFSGLHEFAKMIQRGFDTDYNLEGRRHPVSRWFQRTAVTFSPYSSLIRSAKKTVDPTVTTVPSSTFGEEMLGELAKVASIPGWDPQLPPLLDPLTGEPIVVTGINGAEWVNNIWFSGLINASPHVAFQVPARPTSPVKLELAKQGVGFSRYSGNSAKRRFTENGRMKQNIMNHEEYTEWTRLRTTDVVRIDGKDWTLYERLNYIIGSQYYNNLPEFDTNREININLKKKELEKEIKRFDDNADQRFLVSAKGARIRANTAAFSDIKKAEANWQETKSKAAKEDLLNTTNKVYENLTGN